jgi:splicing factor 3B subunit 4
MPRDKVTNTHQGYAFVEFESPEDADYAIKCALVALAGACAHLCLFFVQDHEHGQALWQADAREHGTRCAAPHSIRMVRFVLLQASKDRKQEEFFANLFIGNLDREVDEKLLHDTFSRFGAVISCKVFSVCRCCCFRGAHRMFFLAGHD